MTFSTQTRVETRALIAAIVVGVLVGFAVGGAYWAGGMAQAATRHARVTRLAVRADGAFSESAFLQATANMEPGALAVARAHDPFTVAGAAERDRQASVIAARLEMAGPQPQRRGLPLQLRGVFGGSVFNPAARPYRMTGALDASRDLECLTQAVYYEARGESAAGQQAVAQVVLNRVRHPAFPKTICGVVFQGAYGGGTCQFSFTCDGSMRARREAGAWTRARNVAARALSGYVMEGVGNATNFHTTSVAPPWGPRMTRVSQVGTHVFYRFGGQAGAPGAFNRQPGRSSPETVTRPVYAGGAADPTITADGKSSPVMAATAIVVAPGPVPAGMGGATAAPSEPASAPVEAPRPAAAHPAAAGVLKPAPTPAAAS